MDIQNIIQTIAVYAIPVLFAITLHEAAHGYAARYFGDDLAYRLGRLSLNPIRHIDPMGTIAMPLILYVVTGGNFLFGYAKPVPVRFGQLKNPKRDMIWVAFAGPAANFVMALGWGILLYLQQGIGLQEEFFIKMCSAGVVTNLVMFALNLFPLPPLDGGRILVGLLPHPLAEKVSRVEPFGFFIVLGLMVAGIFSTLWLLPVMRISQMLLDIFLTPFRMIVG